jgi:hypothetical protein
MQGLIQQMAMLAAQADETDEQRADRLQESAESAECDPTTLYEVEQDFRGLAQHYADQNPDKLAEVKQLGQTYAPTLGMDAGAAEDALSVDTAASLLGQAATANPEVVALAVKTLHESFERRGLYAELGTETPPAGALQPVQPIDAAEGGEDE